MIHLRDYQALLYADVLAQWQAGAENVAAVLPCGGGKTVLFAHAIDELKQPSVAIAHRTELVNQMAMALARVGVPHRVIGPPNLIRLVVNSQNAELGTNFYNRDALCAVAGVDTLRRRESELRTWLPQVKLWVIDECHHVVTDNKWGKATDMFPNAKGLGVTATPTRADGKGIGRHADGVFDAMVEGPDMRQLINMGWLTDYRIFAPPSDMKLDDVGVGKDGDYNRVKLAKASQRSRIVGDVVENYIKYASGKLGITFVTDVETGGQMVSNYRAAGVSAELITAKTPAATRGEIVRRFRKKELLQLVNVDIFGEGFDLPAIEVVSMARPTKSYGLFCQQFGRGLRLLEGKDKAIIIDHVGNVVQHGLPDKPRQWDMDAREKNPRAKNPDDDIPLCYCAECTQPYEKIRTSCPYCGWVPVPAARSAPELVDGDLFELDPEVLKEMRNEVARVDDPQITIQRMLKARAPTAVIEGYRRNALARSDAQASMRMAIDWWVAFQKQKGRSVRESQKLFYLTFGVDLLTVRTLGKADTFKMADRINEYIGRMAA